MDLRKCDVALFIIGLKDIVHRIEVEGPTSHIAAYKQTKSIWGS